MNRVTNVLLLLTALVACDPAPYVHVEAGSRPDSLLFHIYEASDSLDPAAALSELTVRRCGGELMWELTRVTGPRPNEKRLIRYGESPDHFWRVHRRPATITEGCYVVTTETYALPASHRFIVQGDSVSPSRGKTP
jgi:hypothetical protein